jgi:hypothetical protein
MQLRTRKVQPQHLTHRTTALPGPSFSEHIEQGHAQQSAGALASDTLEQEVHPEACSTKSAHAAAPGTSGTSFSLVVPLWKLLTSYVQVTAASSLLLVYSFKHLVIQHTTGV